MKFKLEGSKPSSFQFTISKIKFAGENRVLLGIPNQALFGLIKEFLLVLV